MKKVVIKLNFLDDKIKQNPMQAVSSIAGIVSMEMNTKDSKITIIGDVDPVQVVKKLKKWLPQIDTVGPVKEDKKEDKKPAGDDKKPAGDMKEGTKKPEPTEQEIIAAYYMSHYPQIPQYTQYSVQNYEENPNSCVIC